MAESTSDVDKPPARHALTQGQLHWLGSRLSSDDHKRVKDEMKACVKHMFLTRSLPFTSALVLSLFFARWKLPSHLHVGPKKDIIFFSIIGGASILGCSIFTMTSCAQKMLPTMVELFNKYDADEDGRSKYMYNKLRLQNRYPDVGTTPYANPDYNVPEEVREKYPEFMKQPEVEAIPEPKPEPPPPEVKEEESHFNKIPADITQNWITKGWPK